MAESTTREPGWFAVRAVAGGECGRGRGGAGARGASAARWVLFGRFDDVQCRVVDVDGGCRRRAGRAVQPRLLELLGLLLLLRLLGVVRVLRRARPQSPRPRELLRWRRSPH